MPTQMLSSEFFQFSKNTVKRTPAVAAFQLDEKTLTWFMNIDTS